jgi:hypothetical protein
MNAVSGIEEATRALMATENEKEEIRLCARNVVISDLPSSNDYTDQQLLESFCDQYLTVKPILFSGLGALVETKLALLPSCVPL